MDDFQTNTTSGISPGDARERISRETRAAASLASDLRGTVGKSAGEAAGAVRDEAVHMADRAQGKASESLSSFARSVRQASDDLSRSDPGVMSDIMGQAADAVDGVADALGNRSAMDTLETLRRFGRDNPGAFMLGSLAAGLALGRFAISSGTRPHEPRSGAQENVDRTPPAGGSDYDA